MYVCVCVCVCLHVCLRVCQGVIMENKGLVVQSETVGFEVRWEMLFCLAEQTQWSYSASPLTAHCPPTTSPPYTHTHTNTHTHGCRDSVEYEWRPAGERGMECWGMRELLLNLRAVRGG